MPHITLLGEKRDHTLGFDGIQTSLATTSIMWHIIVACLNDLAVEIDRDLFSPKEKEAIVKLFLVKLALSKLDPFLFEVLAEGKLARSIFDPFNTRLPVNLVVKIELESATASVSKLTHVTPADETPCIAMLRTRFIHVRHLEVFCIGIDLFCHHFICLVPALAHSIFERLQVDQAIDVDFTLSLICILFVSL